MNIQDLLRFSPVWENPDAGGGGDGTPPAGDAGAPPADGGAAPPDGAPGGGGETTAGRSSILDFAPKKGADGAPAGDWKLPDGLEVPEHLLGKSAEETLAKLSTAYKGARTELATRKKADGVLEGAVPKDIDGYKFEGDAEKDPVIKDLTSTESKPFVDGFRKAALELGIPDKTFAAFLEKGMRNLGEAGLVSAVTPQQTAELQKINGEAEFAALQEMVGKPQSDQIMLQIDGFGQRLAGLNVLRDAADVAEFGQMFGTARAALIGSRMLAAILGEQPIPPGDGVDGVPSMDEAYQALADAQKITDASERQAAIERAEANLNKASQAGSTRGQVRSRVL